METSSMEQVKYGLTCFLWGHQPRLGFTPCWRAQVLQLLYDFISILL